MQDLWDNAKKKKKKNDRQSAILDFISAKFVMGYPSVSHYVLFYMLGPAIFLWLGLTKILQNYWN